MLWLMPAQQNRAQAHYGLKTKQLYRNRIGKACNLLLASILITLKKRCLYNVKQTRLCRKRKTALFLTREPQRFSVSPVCRKYTTAAVLSLACNRADLRQNYFMGAPLASLRASDASFTSKSVVLLLSSTNFLPSHFLISARPE